MRRTAIGRRVAFTMQAWVVGPIVCGVACIVAVGTLSAVLHLRARLVVDAEAIRWRAIVRWHSCLWPRANGARVRTVGVGPFRQTYVLLLQLDGSECWLDLPLWPGRFADSLLTGGPVAQPATERGPDVRYPKRVAPTYLARPVMLLVAVTGSFVATGLFCAVVTVVWSTG